MSETCITTVNSIVLTKIKDKIMKTGIKITEIVASNNDNDLGFYFAHSFLLSNFLPLKKREYSLATHSADFDGIEVINWQTKTKTLVNADDFILIYKVLEHLEADKKILNFVLLSNEEDSSHPIAFRFVTSTYSTYFVCITPIEKVGEIKS